MKHSPSSVNKPDSHLKFEVVKFPHQNLWTLRAILGRPSDKFWQKGISPVSAILTRCGIMDRCGHKIGCLFIVNGYWLTDHEMGLLQKALPNAKVAKVEDSEASRSDYVQMGLFDRAIPPFP